MPTRKIVAGTARQFQHTCSGYDVNTLWCYITNSAGTLSSSGAASSSGDGVYYCHLQVPSAEGEYVVRWQAIYGTLANGSAAHWLSTMAIEIVNQEEME